MNFGAEDPYAVLGVQTGASDDEIRKAYLSRVRSSPPDRDPEGFRKVREAYETLRTQTDRVAQSVLADPRLPDVSPILREMASEPVTLSAGLVRAQILALVAEVALGVSGDPVSEFRPVPERRDTEGGM